MSLVVVRMRGRADRRHDHKKTLELLRLHRIHHATIVPENAVYQGMVKKVEHFVTYGKLSEDAALKLLESRGRAPGNKPLTDAYVAEHTPYATLSELAAALTSGDADLGKLEGIKPVFRLAPAKGGFEGKKRHFNEGGALGNRGENINELIERML